MNTIRCKNNSGGYSEISKDKFFFRPSVYGFIIDEGKVVLMNNKSNGKLMETALKREILEETGLEVDVIKLLLTKENFFYFAPKDAAYHAFLFFYLCRARPNQNLINDGLVNDIESEKPRWIELKTLVKEDFSDLKDEIYKLLKSL
ncbi:MAG: NUDIX domain-containing protein [Candidatus Uhrbacteria bacterium]